MSRSVVQRTLSGAGNVSPAARRRVISAARRLGYPIDRPSPVGRKTTDAQVVPTDALAHEIERWLRIPEMTVEELARRSGQGVRKINYIRALKSQHTSYGIADSLCTAMGVVHLVQEGGRLAPLPNPRWTGRRYGAWVEQQLAQGGSDGGSS